MISDYDRRTAAANKTVKDMVFPMMKRLALHVAKSVAKKYEIKGSPDTEIRSTFVETVIYERKGDKYVEVKVSWTRSGLEVGGHVNLPPGRSVGIGGKRFEWDEDPFAHFKV